MVPSGALTPHLALARMHPGPRIALEPGHDAHEEQDEREKAVAALRQEIPDFDARIEKEKAKSSSVRLDPASDPHARPGNQNARKKEENAVANSNPVSPKTKGSTKSETIIARLKRDAATDTLAAALLGRIDPPAWPSSAPSRLLARLPLTLTLLMTPRGSGAG